MERVTQAPESAQRRDKEQRRWRAVRRKGRLKKRREAVQKTTHPPIKKRVSLAQFRILETRIQEKARMVLARGYRRRIRGLEVGSHQKIGPACRRARGRSPIRRQGRGGEEAMRYTKGPRECDKKKKLMGASQVRKFSAMVRLQIGMNHPVQSARSSQINIADSFEQRVGFGGSKKSIACYEAMRG